MNDKSRKAMFAKKKKYSYYEHDNHLNNYGDKHIKCKDCGYHVSTWTNTKPEAVKILNTSFDHKWLHNLKRNKDHR